VTCGACSCGSGGRATASIWTWPPEPLAIEITPDGWAIVQDPPVHLVFSPTAKPLPAPVPGARKAVLRQLNKFFGFKVRDDRFVLLLGVMLAGLMPQGPYPILILSGEQGSGKTTRSRFIKIVIDPTKASVRGRPRSAEDLAISVWRSWFALFDNLSKLDQDMSDWLCRLSEGAGLPKRKLYTDSEEILIEAARPIMLTAIPDIAQSGDLIDRSALIRCDPLPTKMREQVLLDQFEAFRPQLLHYLIQAVSCALRRRANMVDTHDGLRRGDWCAWVEAAAPALGLREGRFTEATSATKTRPCAWPWNSIPWPPPCSRLWKARPRPNSALPCCTPRSRRSRASSTSVGCLWTGPRCPITSPGGCGASRRCCAGSASRSNKAVTGSAGASCAWSTLAMRLGMPRKRHQKKRENQPQELQQPQNVDRTDLKLLRLLRLKNRKLLTRRAKHPLQATVPIWTAPPPLAHPASGAACRSTVRWQSSSTGNGGIASPATRQTRDRRSR
jgi:hypothetical protein